MKETPNKYQAEYENSTKCFWSTTPAKYVELFTDLENIDVSNLNILDLGAGEGKNAVFLANLNAKVTAVEISPIALSRFEFQPKYESSKQRITLIKKDIRNLNFEKVNFDVIVAYGILHCLDSRDEIFSMLNKIQQWLKPGGHFICATFTDKLPVPEVQSYLKIESFLKEGELESSLNGFAILKLENSTITETHSTTKIEHSHSIVRLIARKDG